MLEIANQSYNHKGSCRTQTFNNMYTHTGCIPTPGRLEKYAWPRFNNMCIRSSFFFLLPASCEKIEGLGTGYNPM